MERGEKYIETRETLKKVEEFWKERILGKAKRNIFEPYWGKTQVLEDGICDYKINKDIYEKIIKISKGNDLLIYIVMLTGLEIQINNYVNEDCIINIPRYKEKSISENSVNQWLPIRASIDGKKKVSDTIKECRLEVMKAYENQQYPLKNILDGESSDDVNSIIGQICCGMSNIHESKSLNDIKDNKIYIYIERDNDDITLKVGFNPNNYDVKVMKNFVRNYEVTLCNMLKDIKSQVEEVTSITDDEMNLVINVFNNTKTNYPSKSSVKELFEETVEKYPNNIAAVTPDCKITYRELNDKADKVARLLRSKAIKPGDIVPIISEKDINTLIGILGIVKSGAAYMPIDTEYPQERVNYMLKEASSRLIIGLNKHLKNISIDVEKIDIENIEDVECNDDKVVISPNDLIYIMYTSGSTGEPKGVSIENKSVVRLVKNVEWIDFDRGDKIIQTGSMGFDAATFDIWGSLLNGLELHLIPKRSILDAKILKEYMWESKVTTAFFTSALFNQLCNEDIDIFKYMKHVMVGGDVVSPIVVSKLLERNKNVKVYNGYGPTENTTFSTTFKAEGEWNKDCSFPIGKPISNSTCYIMNDNNKVLPVGMVGNLYVGGDGVARGYLNKVEMTEEKFIENPYVENDRLYKTGDLARWLPDGNIEYFGRIDKQVKVNGFRIEIDEIEKAILNSGDIKEAVVIDRKAKNNSNNKKLYAYVVSESNIDEEDIKNKLKDKLPKYMIPFKISQVGYIPLNINGKVDKNKLVELSVEDNREIVAPKTHTEEVIFRVWSEVLGEDSISIKDNFLNVGGDSIKAINVVSRLRKELEVEVGIVDIFSESTLEEIAVTLESREHETYKEIKHVEKLDYYETSSSQKRMYLVNQMNKQSTGYNMPYIMVSKLDVDINKLENCINEIINRHESLRTTFHVIDNNIMQKVHDEFKININVTELDALLADKQKVQELVKSLVKPFDLENMPMLRCSIIKLQDANLIFIDTHHIIVDGESLMILMNELNMLYKGETIDYEPVQYKDYAFEENNKVIESQKKYWMDKFNRTLEALELPLDYRRPKKQSFRGNHISLKVDSLLRGKIDEFVTNKGVSKNMIYLSALGVLLSKYSRQEEVVIGIPSAGRTNVEVQNTIGMFVNTLATIINPADEKNFETLVSEVKNEIINVTENQDYQFDKLIEDLNIVRNDGRNPLFDVMFSFNNFAKNLSQNNDFELYEVENEVSKFDMTVIVSDDGEDDSLTVEYATDLFKEDTVNRMMNQYIFILKQLINNSNKNLKDLELVNDSEKEKVLFKFNQSKRNYRSDKSICEIFKETSHKYAEKKALVYQNKSITYKELNRISNNIAGLLKEKGVKNDDIVAIVCQKNMDTIIKIVGITMSGAAYMPIDETYPQERKKHMIEDSKTRLVIASKEEIEKLQKDVTNCEFIDFDTLNNLGDFEEVINTNSPESLANVIYTSGSTGKPKGVCVTHKNVMRLVDNNVFCDFKDTDRVIQTGSIAFDASTFEIWGTLLNGATLYIEDKSVVIDIEKLIDSLDTNKITIMFITAALFNQMGGRDLKKLKHLRRVLTGGDVVSSKAVAEVQENSENLMVMDVYGPTENGVMSTYFEVPEKWDSDKIVPIGKPISNTTCYVLDNNNKLLPIGALGELCVGGDGVARGYLYREELTKEKFIKNPYVDDVIYKTGDLVRWLPDGNIEFNGRIDKQVKINGFRIEIEEIERTLVKDERIQEAAIICKEIRGDKKLIAFVVTEKEFDAKEIKNDLKQVLPVYMIPASIVRIDKIPLNHNGKVDNRKLSKIEIVEETNYESARNIVEMKIYNIWKEVLDRNAIDINDNFFDIGGSSILTVKVSNMIRKELEINIPVSEIYSRATIKELAQYIDENFEQSTGTEDFDENIILLKQGNKEGKNLFFIPDGTGDPSGFINIINSLSDEFTCWGIKSDKFNSYAPKVVKVEEEAKAFFEKIKKVQKEGPYNFVSFCYGSYLVAEIIQALEKEGHCSNKIVAIDSIPLKVDNREIDKLYSEWSSYPIEDEIKYIKEELSTLKYDENSKNVDELWDSVVELNKNITKKEMDYIKSTISDRFIISRNDTDNINLRRLIKHMNIVRSSENATALYRKEYKVKDLKCKLNFVKASKNELFENEFKHWKEIYSNESEFIEVEGSHFSIMKGESAVKIADIVNKVFK